MHYTTENRGSSMEIEESGLKFNFPTESIAIKFDDTDFYRKRYNVFPDSKGVDFISDTKEFFVFTEVKNCKGDETNNIWRIYPDNKKADMTTGRDSLDIEVTQKVVMTLAALAGVNTYGSTRKDTEELINFAKKTFGTEYAEDRKKILVILFLEGDFGSTTRPKKMVMKDLQDSINKKLRWLKCRVSVVDSKTYNKKVFEIK